MSRWVAVVGCWLGIGALALPACRWRPAAITEPIASVSLTQGPLTAEVTHLSALVWGRCSGAGILELQLAQTGASQTVAVDAAHDFTGVIPLVGLTPDSRYEYDLWCSGARAESKHGTFQTAPPPQTARPVKLAWGGDVGGQNVCRDAQRGYPIFTVLAERQPDAFIALGDMVYVDDPCLRDGRYGNLQVPGPPLPSVELADFWSYWRYNREDPALRTFLASTASYAVWDDHEVRNDFGPNDSDNAAGQPLFASGLRAFRDYNPIATGDRMYRSVRWGRHVELFLLDNRSYRDVNAAPDTAEHPKTMLGREQVAWLEAAVARSDATWKIIVTSVPLVIPTSVPARGRDGWSGLGTDTGFARELHKLIHSFQRNGVRNQLWISTDVHFAAVFRHFADEPHASFYEIETGPLHAGVFPKQELDPSLRSQRLFLHPTEWTLDSTFDRALEWFNFGMLEVDTQGALTIDIVNALGKTLYRLQLKPT